MRGLSVVAVLVLAGCASAPQRVSVDQATITNAHTNNLCAESNENAWKYLDETIARIQDELGRRQVSDCSQGARTTRLAQEAAPEELCAAVVLAPAYFPQSGPPAQAEIDRRKIVCDPQKTNLTVQAYIAKQQQDAQLAQARVQAARAQAVADAQRQQGAMNALLMMQALTPAPAPVYFPPANRSTNCTTTYIGNQARTNCN